MKVALVVLLASTAALGIFDIHVFRQLQAEREQTVPVVSSPKPAVPVQRSSSTLTKSDASEATTVPASKDVNAGSPPVVQKTPDERQLARILSRRDMQLMYGDLIRQLQLSSRQASMFIDLLTEYQVNLAETSRNTEAALAAASARRAAAADAAIASILGPEGFRMYQEYKKTEADRRQIVALNSHLSGLYAPLSFEQRQALLAVMRSEGDRQPPPEIGSGADAEASAFSPPSAILQWREGYRQRLHDRAAQVLTVEQLREFDRQQLELAEAELWQDMSRRLTDRAGS